MLAVRPLPPFAAVARLGHAQALVDRDGVTRRFLARESDGNAIYAHLALELLAGVNGAMPGVAFVANVLDAGRTGWLRTPASAAWQWALAGLLVLATVLLAYPLWSWRRLESSLATMTRDTQRIAGLPQPENRPGAAPRDSGPHFLEPVENRIAAITHAVNKVSDALAVHDLGLALVQLVAQKHQATIDVQQEPGGDFRIALQLPLAPVAVSAPVPGRQ